MDAAARQTLIDEWTARGRSIATFVTVNVPPEIVPVSVFDHPPTAEPVQPGDVDGHDDSGHYDDTDHDDDGARA